MYLTRISSQVVAAGSRLARYGRGVDDIAPTYQLYSHTLGKLITNSLCAAQDFMSTANLWEISRISVPSSVAAVC